MMSANNRIRFGLQIVFVCLYITPSHYHHCVNLSEDIELIKCLSDISLSSVWVRLSIFFQLSIIQYMSLCVLSLPISLLMIERIHTVSYYHHQIGRMNYYPLFKVMSWNNGMPCMPHYILEKIVAGAPNDTKKQNNARQKTDLKTVMGCCWPMYNVTWYLYPYYEIKNTEL